MVEDVEVVEEVGKAEGCEGESALFVEGGGGRWMMWVRVAQRRRGSQRKRRAELYFLTVASILNCEWEGVQR